MIKIPEINAALLWAIPCLQTGVDGETNEFSLYKVVEQLNVQSDKKLPATKGVLDAPIAVPINFQLATLWKKLDPKQPASFEVRVEHVDPQGNVRASIEGKLVIPADKIRVRHRLNIAGMPVSQSGEYLLRVSVRKEGRRKFEVAAEVPVDVLFKNG